MQLRTGTISSFVAMISCLIVAMTACGNDNKGTPALEFPAFSDLSVEETTSMIQQRASDPDFVILDVRTFEEFTAEHIKDAVNLDYYAPDFQVSIGNLDRNKTYLVYCGSGMRSRPTVDLMRQEGFIDVYNLAGGIASMKDTADGSELLASCGCP